MTKSNEALKKVLYIDDVHAWTGIEKATLRWMRSVGRGPKSFKVGRRIAYLEEDVAAYLREAYEKDNPAA